MIEANSGTDRTGSEKLPLERAVMVELANTMRGALSKIEHCVNQLSDAQLNWRPFESQNSVANVILHLCGNVRQWIINGLTGAPDERDRMAEFSDRQNYSRAELLERIRGTTEEAIETLLNLPSEQVQARRRIQGFETNVLQAGVETVSHFVGHAHEIVYITRLQLKETYLFQFVPKGKEQGGE